jgi:hypothetical protein
MVVKATHDGMVHITSSFSHRGARKRWMARGGHGLVRWCGRWPGSGGVPSWPGLGCRTRSTGASGCRPRRRWPRCWALAQGRGPSPARDRCGDGQATGMGHASGPEGPRCPPSVGRQRRGVPLASSRSTVTPQGQRSQGSAHHVPANPGSPEGCSQPSSPPLCGGVMTDSSYPKV